MSSLRKNLFPKLFIPRIIALIILDILVSNLAVFLALYIRHDFKYTMLSQSGFLDTALQWLIPNTVLVLVVFAFFRLYATLWNYAGGNELVRIFAASIFIGLLQLIPIATDLVNLPMSFPVLFAAALFILTTVVRFSYRFIRRVRYHFSQAPQSRTMVIGAGDAGVLVLREFQSSRHSQNKVVCVIDDDPLKIGRQIMGVPIIGGRDLIETAVDRYNISEIVLAIPTLSSKTKKEIWDICSKTKCKFKQMPGIYQLANGEVSIQEIRDIDIEDLLEREVIHVDMDGISDLVQGKTVMVTGGGGSIGSELCRQLASYQPEALIIFDIYENNAYNIELELRRQYPELKLHALIGSVRDAARIDHVMKTHRPSLVFHAAAHKHVPLMETSPLEAVKNNVLGTLNTAKAAAKYEVEHFVLISTDKAVNPTNVMGASKRICEMIVQSLAGTSKTCFAAVRFGNVLGSNGSVIPLFREQIKKGGPVTVTHPDITRFFMTIPEAVSLVLQAGAFAKGGEIFVLDMGRPVKIDDLARNMIRLSGFEPDVDINVVYSGLRPGEKLYEELLMGEEGLAKTSNDLIYIGHKIDFDTEQLYQELDTLKQLTEGQETLLRSRIKVLVPTYVNPAEKLRV
jgi:FlaA1/EpsC-like NDP-sugar epimerase